jgi:hypothetical protein
MGMRRREQLALGTQQLALGKTALSNQQKPNADAQLLKY